MTDRREMILARLLEIAVGVDGIVAVFRNKDEISERQRPAIVILDADEAADDADPNSRPSRAPRRVADNLTLEEQADLLAAIVELTMPRGLSPLVERLSRLGLLAGGGASAMQATTSL